MACTNMRHAGDDIGQARGYCDHSGAESELLGPVGYRPSCHCPTNALAAGA